MKIKAALCLALLAIILLPGAGSAQQQGEHPARKMWAVLNLTPEQEAKFREINARYAPARRDQARIIEDLRVKINQELLKEKPSRSLLIQYAGQMGEHQKKMSVASVDHLLSVKAVLTPDQFKIFAERVSVGGGPGGPRRRAESGGSKESADDEE